ncbi:flavin reductase family protein [Pirellulimonas nuda]|nr:flavin reductase family protein [Pirellulimonas nuda]
MTDHTDPLAALGRVPSGIFILTAGAGERATGMLASWVMQAGFEPPMVTVAVKQGRYVAQWLTEGTPFVLNQLAEGQSALMKHFAKGFEPNEPAFQGLEVSSTASGAPALAAALGRLECEPTSHVDSGDHRIFLARVTGGGVAVEDSRKPTVHVRKSGNHY